THLHNLLAVDHRFAYPNFYQVMFPHTFLSTEKANAKLVGFFLPKTRPHDEADPIGQVRRIYEALALPDFQDVEPALQRYVESQTGYKKNVFREIPAELRARIAREWRRCFEEWGYPS